MVVKAQLIGNTKQMAWMQILICIGLLSFLEILFYNIDYLWKNPRQEAKTRL